MMQNLFSFHARTSGSTTKRTQVKHMNRRQSKHPRSSQRSTLYRVLQGADSSKSIEARKIRLFGTQRDPSSTQRPRKQNLGTRPSSSSPKLKFASSAQPVESSCRPPASLHVQSRSRSQSRPLRTEPGAGGPTSTATARTALHSTSLSLSLLTCPLLLSLSLPVLDSR